MSETMTVTAAEVRVGDVLVFGGMPAHRPVKSIESVESRVIIQYGMSTTSALLTTALTVLRD